MSETLQLDVPTKPGKPRLIAAALEYGAIVVAAASFVWFVVSLFIIWGLNAPADESVTVESGFAGYLTLAAAVLLVVGFGGALVMWALGEAVRQFDDMSHALQRATQLDSLREPQPVTQPAPSAPSTSGVDPRLFDELRHVLLDIRDLTMMDEEQRAARYDLQGKELGRELEREIPHLLREHDWATARQRVRVARERFPSMAIWEELESKVDETRQAVEAHDLEDATRQVNDLASLGAWDRALEIVRDLMRRHADSPRVEEFARRVARERDKAEADERARLMAQAQAASDQKEWRQALQLANQVIERFPKSVEAESLRQQLPTLRDNSEIQARQEMESKIRDLIKDHRFAEALTVANRLIEQFPHSPQADVLREQLPRLKERAAEKARV